MLEQFYTQTSVITQFRHGLLGPYLDDLATTLHEQGYAQASIRCSLRYCHQFGQWLEAQGSTVAEVDETLVEQYLNGFPRARDGRRPRVAQGLPHLIGLLRHQGIPPPHSRPFTTALDQWLRQYEQYLAQVLGAAAGTRKSYLLIARRLLRACFGTAPLDWQVRSYWIPGSYVTSNSMSAGSNALPRLRTLCTHLTGCKFC